jgi:hypothetical protein
MSEPSACPCAPPAPRVVERRLPLEHTDGTPLSPVLLRWTADDPAAVTLRFHPRDMVPGGSAVWEFARELLLTGLIEFVGDGDVQVWPVPALMALHVAVGRGDKVTVQLPWAQVQQFLRQTCRVVRPGNEIYDVDAAIAACLEGIDS